MAVSHLIVNDTYVNLYNMFQYTTMLHVSSPIHESCLTNNQCCYGNIISSQTMRDTAVTLLVILNVLILTSAIGQQVSVQNKSESSTLSKTALMSRMCPNPRVVR